MATAIVVASQISTVRADDFIKRDVHKDYDKSVASISKEARRLHSEGDALHVVAVQTGVPKAKTQEMLDHWSDAGVAGVMIACTISDYTKVDPAVYMKQRFHDHVSWDRIIADARVPFERVDRNLTRLDDYVHSGPREEHSRAHAD